MSNDSQSSGEEEEISPLQYARQNGLSCDHLKEPMPRSCATIIEGIADGVTDDSHLNQFEFAEYNTDERLPLSKDAAILIAWATTPEKEELIRSIVQILLDSTQPKARYLELPVLMSDHETDCRQFARREGFEIKLADIRLPLELVDDEKGEGIIIPTKLWSHGTEIMEELKNEKISVTKETMTYLTNGLKLDWDRDVETEVRASIHKYQKSRVLEPVTPPLSPLPQPTEPFEPSSSDPAFQLPILSDPVSLTQGDLQVIEKRILEQDALGSVHGAEKDETSVMMCHEKNKTSLGDIYSPLASEDGVITSPLMETQWMKHDLLKIEETLTPPGPSPVPKTVHFSSIVEEMLLKSTSSPNLEITEDTFFEEAFGDAGERVMRQAEQETLIAADTTARVEVPILDFSTVDPPWKKLDNQNDPSDLLVIQKALFQHTNIGQELPRWPDVKRTEIKLKWNPFPHELAQVKMWDDFEMDDDVWKVIVNDPGGDDILNTSCLTWKRPGLRILMDEDEDDDIEPGQFLSQEPQDLSYLVKKRKAEIEEREVAAKTTSFDPNSRVIAQPAKEATSQSRDFITAAQKLQAEQQNDDMGLLGEAFSIANALDNYLEIRGTKKQKFAESPHFPSNPANSAAKSVPAPDIVTPIPLPKSPMTITNPLPAPLSQPPSKPPSIIISSLLLKNRALIKQLEAQLPGLRIIERDFSSHNTTAWLPNSVIRSPIASSLAFEADINISPSTGIILTTLQKIKQKPLPGQKTKPASRDRLEKVGVRYERLIVLVGEGGSDDEASELDESDCMALSEFIGFTLGLDTTVNVHFVGGGEETLSRWLVSIIIRYSDGGGCDLLDDETHWELFLRRAGMNAFAAQAVIADLKAPEGVDPWSPSKAGHFGLVAFVEMGLEQRVVRFGGICGRKVLERVSAAIDARWE